MLTILVKMSVIVQQRFIRPALKLIISSPLIQHHCFHFLPSLEGGLEGPVLVEEPLSIEIGQDETQLLLLRSMC